ncbi:MAG: hypothetical protein M3525_09245 [Acidobacteriota bacterium]|nr:hypothetical protein [Acidobacteriota bacterium]
MKAKKSEKMSFEAKHRRQFPVRSIAAAARLVESRASRYRQKAAEKLKFQACSLFNCFFD